MNRKDAALHLGILLAAAVFLVAHFNGLNSAACWTASITVLCAVWWVTEAIPIPATSLVPFALFPLTGVLDHKQVAQSYGHYIILLLLGGFILSKAIERSGAHRRMALGMVNLFGRFGRRGLVLGFMIATASSSMWISNTATVLMLLPVAQAVLAQDSDNDLELPLLLGIAYAASIGGIGTPIGTPPNVVFMGIYAEYTGREISFPEWMSWGIPLVLVFIPVTWLVVTRRVGRGPMITLPELGRWRRPEVIVTIIFTLTALAWILRKAPFGGWSDWLDTPGAGDDTVALLAVCLLFALPNGEGDRMLTWDDAKEIPWGLLILFGGGLAIAKAFGSSGLSQIIGDSLAEVTSQQSVLMIGIIAITVTFLTELTSNTATTTLLMPILASASIAAAVDPRLLMVPAAMSASCAFMLPVATAPNAIMFGTGRVPILRMARTGFLLNLIGVVLITVVASIAFS